jgi:DNA processing protein
LNSQNDFFLIPADKQTVRSVSYRASEPATVRLSSGQDRFRETAQPDPWRSALRGVPGPWAQCVAELIAVACRRALPYYSRMTRPGPAKRAEQGDPNSGQAFTAEELVGPLNAQEQLYAPKQLFAAGHLEWLRRSPRVAVVGARKASPEGLKRAAKLARLLVSHDATVVSGLAEGIDAAAHTAAVEAGGRTIAVIGTPLSETFPAKHRVLQQRLMREHLVLSQFPEGASTTRKNFPLRNRTMALISDASVIVEASDGSGSLSQGWEALRLGRPLFLMASILDRRGLVWPRTMLDYGAVVLHKPEDLFAQLPEHVDDALAVLA